jgi:dynein heavy chain
MIKREPSHASDTRYTYIINKVIDAFKIEPLMVQNAIMKSKENSTVLDSFFQASGSNVLIFIYKKNPSNGEVNDYEESDYDDAVTVKSGFSSATYKTTLTRDSAFESENSGAASSRSPRSNYDDDNSMLTVTTDPSKHILNDGVCVYFIKREPHSQITMSKVADELLFGTVQGGVGILEELKRRLEGVIVPILRQQNDWGELTKEGAIPGNEVNDFLESLDKFTGVVGEAISSLGDVVRLAPPKKYDDIKAKSKSYHQNAQKAEVVAVFEETLSEWCKQIEVLLGEVTAIREENDESGPAAELEYWKARMAKFNSITDQLRSRRCKIVLGVLKYAKSPSLLNWKAIDMKITDAANEAKDNVKYLYILEKYTEPLYKCDPLQMIGALPGLINCIKVMHSIARYYNTSERMTALFVKVTNQMITCCKKYITKDGNLWDQDKEELIERFKACIDLNESYQHYYRKTKAELQLNPYGKQFDFSESAIFGKFDQFCWRIQKLIDLFTTVSQFSSLENSTIEGLDQIMQRFKSTIAIFSSPGTGTRKRYNFLDYRTEVRKTTNY